ncbi:histidine kinase CKI1-like [Tasmannia lanceolata]|uniref:histidine kinase CKI1-like n=1 Tax=Tasmannia lanceolata TaxID=3420 RepID=UPI004063072E
MFLAFSIAPHLSQISYIGEDGLFFSYYTEGNHTLALFANTSYSSSGSNTNPTVYRWYSQPVNDIGMRYGEAIDSTPITLVNSSWFNNALDSENGYALLGLGWGKFQEPLFLSMALVNNVLPRGRWGVISLGVPKKIFTNFMSSIDLHGGDLYMVTEDGQLLAKTRFPYEKMLLSNMTVSVQMTESDNFDLPCNLNSYSNSRLNQLSGLNEKIWGEQYTFYCAQFEIAGVRSVSILALPLLRFPDHVHRQNEITMITMVLMLACVFIVSLFFVLLIIRASRREVFLCAALIKQMEATQQAERKSMNKSIAFASASHDVRTALAAITGLIELCRYEVSPESELETNLVQMDTCASNLLGILNSILDTSKIEAGKMQLEMEEFDLAKVFEEIVDMFYVVGSKKGLEVLLDPCDGSIMKVSLVKGDCGRLKQILSNLLSNAVKFTSEGHVVVRAWANKPILESSILASDHGGGFSKLYNFLSRLVCKTNCVYDDLGSLHTVQQSPNSIEFTFEVEDTGKGIPKEKQKSAFENFVQVKESTSKGHEGTGLGLGIVQSLVRLMGGDISIVDKDIGEKGTCFRFNVFLETCENTHFSNLEGEDTNLLADQVPIASHQPNAFGTNVPNPRLHISTPLSVWSTNSKGSKKEGFYSVLLMQGAEGRRIAKKWMDQHGIKVWTVSQWEHFHPVLEGLKQNLFPNPFDPSTKSELASHSSYSSRSPSNKSHGGEKEEYASANEGSNYSLSLNIHNRDIRKKPSFKSSTSYVLIVIDMSCGSFMEACSLLANYGNEIPNSQYKVVWLANSDTPSSNLRRLKDGQAPCDLILQKPFHGSRLCAVLSLLKEFGGTSGGYTQETRMEITVHESQPPMEPDPYINSDHKASTSQSSRPENQITRVGDGPSTDKPLSGMNSDKPLSGMNSDKPLSGMTILVAEDTLILRMLAFSILTRLGATVELAENGKDALDLVCKALHEITGDYSGGHMNHMMQEISKSFSYDIVLMDCEMPIMNGYEATRQIRMEERHYDIHIPIIALTAHAMAEEANKCIQAGMDFHLVKPLRADHLLDAIRNINRG